MSLQGRSKRIIVEAIARPAPAEEPKRKPASEPPPKREPVAAGK
jgi:hypothetical protein